MQTIAPPLPAKIERAPLVRSLAALAEYFWKNVHWEKGADGPRPVREPLKFPHLERHLSGGRQCGLGPVAPGESTTRVAVLDFDNHEGDLSWTEMVSTARKAAAALEHDGYAPIPFRSTGGKGIHLYLLWEAPQNAFSVRAALTAALERCGLKDGTKGVKHHQVEIFPKQASVPLDGLPNMVVLPLAGLSVPLDPPTLELLPRAYAETMAWPHSRPVPTAGLQPERTPRTIAPTVGFARARSALSAIPNEGSESLDYKSWLNVVFGIHHMSGGSDEGLALAHEFSRRSPKYDAAFLDERVWPYVRSDRSGELITERTFFDMARKHNWVEPIEEDFKDLTTSAGQAVESSPITPDAPGGSQAGDSQPGRTAGDRFRVLSHAEFRKRAPPGWIIKGVLPRAELVLIIGQSGSGKTFLALDIAAAVARGVSWRDLKVKKPLSVVYIVAEGAGGFRSRMEAYAHHHNLKELGIGVIAESPNLLQQDDVRALGANLREYGQVDVIVIDTWSQVIAGGDENSAQDMSRALGHCRAIRKATGATVILVHHLGKDATRGARGWSGLKAAADAEIEVRRVDDLRVAEVTKMKDGSDGAEYGFRLVTIPVGIDEDGDLIESCVVQHIDEVPAKLAQPTGEWQLKVWNHMADMSSLAGDGAREVDVVEAVVAAEPEGERPRRSVVRQGIEGLIKKGLIERAGDQLRTVVTAA